MKHLRPKFLQLTIVGYYILSIILTIVLPVIGIWYFVERIDLIWIIELLAITITILSGGLILSWLLPRLILFCINKSDNRHFLLYYFKQSKLTSSIEKQNSLPERLSKRQYSLIRSKIIEAENEAFIDFPEYPDKINIYTSRSKFITPLIFLITFAPLIYFTRPEYWWLALIFGFYFLYDTIKQYRKYKNQQPSIIFDLDKISFDNGESIKWAKLVDWKISYSFSYVGAVKTHWFFTLTYLSEDDNKEQKTVALESFNKNISTIRFLFYLFKNRYETKNNNR